MSTMERARALCEAHGVKHWDAFWLGWCMALDHANGGSGEVVSLADREAKVPAPVGEPVAWMIVNKSGGREARVTYEPSFDVLADLDMRRPADAPHRTVPLYAAPPHREVLAVSERETFILGEGRTEPSCPFCAHYMHSGHSPACVFTRLRAAGGGS